MTEYAFFMTFITGVFLGVIITTGSALYGEFRLEKRRKEYLEKNGQTEEFPFNLINPDSVK